MQRDISVVLGEIVEAIDIAISVCSKLNLERFRSSKVEKLAVQRTIEIISEAARHLPQEELEKYPTVPWRQVKAMGNVLRYEYHHLNDKIIWDVVRDELLDLLAKILQENPHLRGGSQDG